MRTAERSPTKRRPGITRRAVDVSIRSARDAGRLPPGDCIEVALLRLIADELDMLRADTSTKATWAKAQVWRELRDTLTQFGLAEDRSTGAGQAWFLALRAELGAGGDAGALDDQ